MCYFLFFIYDLYFLMNQNYQKYQKYKIGSMNRIKFTQDMSLLLPFLFFSYCCHFIMARRRRGPTRGPGAPAGARDRPWRRTRIRLSRWRSAAAAARQCQTACRGSRASRRPVAGPPSAWSAKRAMHSGSARPALASRGAAPARTSPRG